MKVLLFIRSLNVGGAERQLVLLAKSLHERGLPVAVMVFYAGGDLQTELEDAGVHIIDLRKYGRWDFIGLSVRLIQSIKYYNPDVIYSFMGGANVAAAFAKIFVPGIRIVAGERSNPTRSDVTPYFEAFSLLLSRLAMRFSSKIITNSMAARDAWIDLGVKPSRVDFVANGIDTDTFQYNDFARSSFRLQYAIADETLLIGLVSRVDPIKRIDDFIKASAVVSRIFDNVRFMVIGDDSPAYPAYKGECLSLALQIGVEGCFNFIGKKSDLAEVYSSLDILVLSSETEGFPNVVGEAMACGLPVVATDVGDCRRIIGDRGLLVPPKDVQSLAAAIEVVISWFPDWDRTRSRQRVIDYFSVEAMVNKTLAILNDIVVK